MLDQSERFSHACRDALTGIVPPRRREAPINRLSLYSGGSAGVEVRSWCLCCESHDYRAKHERELRFC